MFNRTEPLIEAYLKLIKDLNKVLAEEWDKQTQIDIRRKINQLIAESLEIAI